MSETYEAPVPEADEVLFDEDGGERELDGELTDEVEEVEDAVDPEEDDELDADDPDNLSAVTDEPAEG